MAKQKEFKPIIVEVINPEALEHASEVVTKYLYKKYLEMMCTSVRLEANKNIKPEAEEQANGLNGKTHEFVIKQI